MLTTEFKEMVDYQVRKREAFIVPSPSPCNHIDCLVYNEFHQCPDCGWLEPFKGDSSSWGNSMRESPLGPGGICMLGLSDAQASFVKEKLG